MMRELSLVEIIVLAAMFYGCFLALYYWYELRDCKAREKQQDITDRYS